MARFFPQILAARRPARLGRAGRAGKQGGAALQTQSRALCRKRTHKGDAFAEQALA